MSREGLSLGVQDRRVRSVPGGGRRPCAVPDPDRDAALHLAEQYTLDRCRHTRVGVRRDEFAQLREEVGRRPGHARTESRRGCAVQSAERIVQETGRNGLPRGAPSGLRSVTSGGRSPRRRNRLRRPSVPLDHYVTLGPSGLRVSPFALGAMTFGEDPGGAGCSVEESEKILDVYADHGGNFVDTANFYTNGHSEKILGDWLAAAPGRRDRVVVASKFFFNLFPGNPNAGGAGRSAIIAQLEESLRRLRTDHIDLYWLHNWDRNTPVEETMRALDDLVRAGKIRYIGFSNVPAWV